MSTTNDTAENLSCLRPSGYESQRAVAGDSGHLAVEKSFPENAEFSEVFV